jgi:hypothetical protein
VQGGEKEKDGVDGSMGGSGLATADSMLRDTSEAHLGDQAVSNLNLETNQVKGLVR